MKLLVGARVDYDLWTRVKVFVAGCAGETLSGFVEKALEARLVATQTPVDFSAIKEMEPARPKRPVTVKVPQPGAPSPVRPVDHAQCVCGEKWLFHQDGKSQTLAKRTNCANFREAQ